MALSSKEIRITTLLVIDTFFFLLEIVVGYMVNSLALIADSFHMLNDIISLVVALWAVNVAKNRSADADYTYGWLRAEILGALINAVFLIALCFTILIEAIQRLLDPPVITNAKLILIVGFFGLLSNIVGLFLFHEHGHSHGGLDELEGGHSHSHSGLVTDEENDLHNHNHSHTREEHTHTHEHENSHAQTHKKSLNGELSPLLSSNPEENDNLRQVMPSYVVGQLNESTIDSLKANSKTKGKHDSTHQKSLNMQGVFLHVLGDALGNVGVMATALLIWKTDYSWKYYFDPIISLVITCIIFSSALPLCKSSSRILLQGTPLTIETSEVVQDILEIPSVLGVHDFHIWNLTEKLLIASLHVELNSSPETFLQVASEIKSCLHDYGIHSATIQPEFSAFYSQQHMLPHKFSSSQDLSQDFLNNGSSTSLNSTFNISSSNINNITSTVPNSTNTTQNPHAPVGSRSSEGHLNNTHTLDSNSKHPSQPEIHCLVDASANCTTSDCLN